MIKEYFGFSGDSGMGLYMLLCVGGVCVVMGGGGSVWEVVIGFLGRRVIGG